MLDDVLDATNFAKTVESAEALVSQKMAQKAIVMSLLNIGELANHLPQEFIAAHPELPWREMIGMRNFAAHGYHVMNLSVIWNTVDKNLPPLLQFLQNYLSENNSN
jgi:uncharacterized protein with HEPN domain